MAKVAHALDSKFVVALGDNFYGSGIHGNAHNPRFRETFEDVYTDKALQTPWYIIAGNHDHLGNVTAQIEYTQWSARWRYPEAYYSWTQTLPGTTTTLQIILIDTVVLFGSDHDSHGWWVGANGPADPYKATQQWQWLQHQLATSTADYLWVGGHYPVWSACAHGPTQRLVDDLRPLLEKYHVTGYMSGHDHCQEFLDEGRGPRYVLTGAGDNCCYTLSNQDQVPEGSLKWYQAAENRNQTIGGFASFTVTSRHMTVTFHDQDGRPMYSSVEMPPRSKVQKPPVQGN
jgi:hypothetical protein